MSLKRPIVVPDSDDEKPKAKRMKKSRHFVESEEDSEAELDRDTIDKEAKHRFLTTVPTSAHLHHDSDKPYIIGIDLGYRDIGFVVLTTDPTKPNPCFAEKSDMLRPASGVVYNKYQEKYVEELVLIWLQERWGPWFSRASLVLIEKQLSTDITTEQDRALICIEMIFRSCLRLRLMSERGPHYSVIGPALWKRKCYIPVGGHHNKRPRGGFTSNANKVLMAEARLENKRRAEKQFMDMYRAGHAFVRYMLDVLKVQKTYDIIDAFFIAYFGFCHFEAAMKKARVLEHHVKPRQMKLAFPVAS